MAENPPNSDTAKPVPQNEAEGADSSTAQQGISADTETWETPAIDPNSPVPIKTKMKMFFAVHFSGVLAFIVPLIFIPILTPFPPEKWQWCAYCVCIMALYWVFEVIPLPVTSFLPVVIFPLTGVMSTRKTCMAYMNDTVLMFIGSIMLAASVEQSGLHKRIALYSIRLIGYSHKKMLFAVAFVTMFISMWITNTAVATMMVPIVFALLNVYESQGLIKIYEKDPKTGEETATPLTSCYFCCITFAATIGGIGTLVGTATNLVFKGLFVTVYPDAPDLISFPAYSGFAIPYMIVCNLFMYGYLAMYYMGLGRPRSEAAKNVQITPDGLKAAEKQVAKEIEALGRLSWHEIMVLILFGAAMVMFFSRSPQVFSGWADQIRNSYSITNTKFIKDSTAATLIIFLMVWLPRNGNIFLNCKAKYADELPKGSIGSVLDWNQMNLSLPYSFSFLLAGGFALSTAAGKNYSNLNGKIGEFLQNLQGLPNAVVLFFVIFFTIFITNFASNVAVCNVLAPIAMELARKVSVNPLWYNMATGVSASFAFMIPVGTPGNLIVQSAAKIPTKHMIVAGAGPTITTMFFTWFFLYFYAPIIWPTLKESAPSWVGSGGTDANTTQSQ